MKIRELSREEKPPIELLLTADPSTKNVKDYLNRGICYVAEKKQQIVGVFILLPTCVDTIELVNIAVLEEHSGKGIGKALVMNALNIAKVKGFKKIEVGTGNSSIDQLAFYQKCDFRITGVDLDFFVKYYDEEIYENGIQCRDMIRMSKQL